MTVRASHSPSKPGAGEEVVFDIVVIDDDSTCDFRLDFGDGQVEEVGCDQALRYGPWTPPTRQLREYTFRETHTYSKAGQYTATFTYRSTNWYEEQRNPSADSGSASVTLTVSDVLVR